MDFDWTILRSGEQTIYRLRGLYEKYGYRRFKMSKFEAYDLYVYIANMENASNNTTLRLNWNVTFGLGDDAPWFVSELPALMISTPRSSGSAPPSWSAASSASGAARG